MKNRIAFRRLALAVLGTALIAMTLPAGLAVASPSQTIRWISKTPVSIPVGNPLTLRGTLADTSGSVAAKEVEIQSSTDGVNFYRYNDLAILTDASGGFSTGVGTDSRATFRAVVAADKTVVTANVVVVPRTDLTKLKLPTKLKKNRKWVSTGYYQTLTGSAPFKVTVVADRLERGKWKRRAAWSVRVSLLPASRPMVLHGLPYAVSLKFSKTGTWRVRPTTPARAGLAAADGPWSLIKIK